MKRSIWAGLSGAVCLSALALSGAAASAAPRVELQTDPPLSQIEPFSEPVTFSLKAVADDGQPLEDAILELLLNTPPKTPWLTTDFPVVEGTMLARLTLPAPQGEAQFQEVPPIRGSYQLQVRVSPRVPGTFEPYTDLLTFQVPENPVKYRNLAILLSILLLAGLGGGWVIGGSQPPNPGEVASRPVQLVLSGTVLVAIATLLYISITAERAGAHTEAPTGQDNYTEPLNAEPVPTNITATLEDQAIATVGQAIPLEVELTRAETGEPISAAVLDINTTSLEYERTVFDFTAQTDTQGEFVWEQQFFDGAPHLVTVHVSPAANSSIPFEPFEFSQRIDVTGVAPPLFVRLVSLGYCTGVLALGTAAGFWLRRRSTQHAL